MEVRGIGYIPQSVTGVKGIGKIDFGRIAKAILSGGASETKVGKRIEDDIQKGAKDVADAVSKSIAITSLWPVRASFLELLRLNYRGYATRIHRMSNTDKIKKRWIQLGGAWGDFNAAVNKGWDKPYLFGVKKGEGARGESDAELITSVTTAFKNSNGTAIQDVVWDTKAGPTTNQTANINTGANQTMQTIGDAYAVAAIVGAAATAIAALVPLINKSTNEDSLEKLNNGQTISNDEANKLANTEAATAYTKAKADAKAAGKTEAQAETEALAAAAAARKKTLDDIAALNKKNQNNSNGNIDVNAGGLLKEAAPLIALGALLFFIK